METKTPTTRSSPRAVLVAGGVLAVLLVGTTLVVAALRGPVEYADGTPEAAVQTYVQAIIDGDEDLAARLLDPEIDCDAHDLADAHVGDDVRVTLRSTEINGTDAEVEIGVTEVLGGGPFDSYEYDEHFRFELAQRGDVWLITRRPWPHTSCWR